MAYTRREDMTVQSRLRWHRWVHSFLWQKRAGQWDQFEANERLFGVKNTCVSRPPQKTLSSIPLRTSVTLPALGAAPQSTSTAAVQGRADA